MQKLKMYQEKTGLNFVMGGNPDTQMRALENFKDMVIAEYIDECGNALVDEKEIDPNYIADEYIARIYEETSGQHLHPQDREMVNEFARAVWLDCVTACGARDSNRVELPGGLPHPNERVAIVDKFGKLDICTFVTQSDGGWYWDNLVDCIYQSDEIQEWKSLVGV